jgi:hypothetical protein
LAATGGDLDAVMHILADSFARLADGPNKTAAMVAILGRGFQSLIPALKGGSDGLDEVRRAADEVGATLSGQTIRALADSQERMNLLGAAATGLGGNLVSRLKPMIDAVTSSLTTMIAALNRALSMSGPGVQVASLATELAGVNAEIAKLKGATSADTSHHMSFEERLAFGRAHPGAGQAGPSLALPPTTPAVTTRSAALASLEARAAEIRAQMDQLATGAMAAGMVAPEAKKPDAGNSAGAKAGGKAGGKGGDTTNKDYQNFAEGERLKIAEAEAANQSIMGILQEWLAQAAKVYGADSTEYKRVQLEIVMAKKAAVAELGRLEKERLDDSLKLQQDAAKAAAKTAKEWAAPFTAAFDKIGSAFDKSITDLLLHKGTTSADMANLYQGMVGEAISAISGGVSKAAAGPLAGLLGTTAQPGQGVGGVLGDAAGGWISKKLSSLFPSLGGGAGTKDSALTANTASLDKLTAALSGKVGGAGGMPISAPSSASTGDWSARGADGAMAALKDAASSMSSAAVPLGAAGVGLGLAGQLIGGPAGQALTLAGAGLSAAATALMIAAILNKVPLPFAAGGWDVPSFAGGGWNIAGGCRCCTRAKWCCRPTLPMVSAKWSLAADRPADRAAATPISTCTRRRRTAPRSSVCSAAMVTSWRT